MVLTGRTAPARTAVRASDRGITLAGSNFHSAAGSARGAGRRRCRVGGQPPSAGLHPAAERLGSARRTGDPRPADPQHRPTSLPRTRSRRLATQYPGRTGKPRCRCRLPDKPFGSTPVCGRFVAAISIRQRSPRARSVRWAWRVGSDRARCPARCGCCHRSCPVSTCRHGWPDSEKWTGCCPP